MSCTPRRFTSGFSIQASIVSLLNWMKIPSPRFSMAGSQETSRASWALVTPISSSPSTSGDDGSERMNQDDALHSSHPGLDPVLLGEVTGEEVAIGLVRADLFLSTHQGLELG